MRRHACLVQMPAHTCRQQPRGESYAQAAQGGERSQQWPPSAGADTFNPMSKHRSEEVYSNNPAVSSRRRPMPTSMPGSAGAHAVNQLPHCSPLPHPQMQMQVQVLLLLMRIFLQ